MPNFKLIVPRDYKTEESLKLEIDTNIEFQQKSEEIHIVYVTEKKDQDLVVETLTDKDEVRDSSSHMQVDLKGLSLYISKGKANRQSRVS